MSVCIAAIYEDMFGGDCIIAASDRKFSFFSTSVEGGEKIKPIHREWHVMFAGNLSPIVPILDAIGDASVKSLKAKKKTKAMRNTLRDFSRLCSKAYRQERKQIIENEVLHNYDIETYEDYRALLSSSQSGEQALYDTLSQKIREEEQRWNLLFCGFDDYKKPHIFQIGEHGKITYWDAVGFAAIGSGETNAIGALSAFRYSSRELRLGVAVYAVVTAKYAAESADGVGQESQIVVLRPQDGGDLYLSDTTVEGIRDRWRELPRLPEGAEKEIDEEIQRLDKIQEGLRAS